jgi:hypothetical protein
VDSVHFPVTSDVSITYSGFVFSAYLESTGIPLVHVSTLCVDQLRVAGAKVLSTLYRRLTLSILYLFQYIEYPYIAYLTLIHVPYMYILHIIVSRVRVARFSRSSPYIGVTLHVLSDMFKLEFIQ